MTYPALIDTLILIFAVIIGSCIGSFANVLIYRIPRGIQFVKGYSVCPICGERIRPYDLIPVLSYLLLRGKCRFCKARISVKYPLVELLSAGLAAASVVVHGYSPAAGVCFLIFIMLAVISFIDAEHMIIPDRLVITLLVLAVLYTVLTWDRVGVSVTSRLIGCFALSLPMFLLTVFIKDAFGGGDMKLSAVCGLMLGWKLMLLTGFVAVLLGGFYGVYVKYIKRKSETSHIAFGQYLCIGVFIAMTAGEYIIGLYLSLLY